MRAGIRLAGTGAAAALLLSGSAIAEPIVWGLEAEQFEYRLGEDSDVLAWDTDAFAGTDELKLRWISKGEYAFEEDDFEELENQARVQVPVSDFFDAVAGVRVNTPAGPDQVYGVLGLHGLAPQWIEVDVDFYIADDPRLRLDAEYEALITNRLILVPSLELDLPFTDDEETASGAFAPTLEVGARLSYDLVDRLISPYVGVHYERAFGESGDIRESEGEDDDELFFVVGMRLLF